MEPSPQITAILARWNAGDQSAMDEVFPLIEAQLKKIARYYIRKIRPGETMETAAVINEAYIRLVGQETNWQNRAHFFGIAASMMHRILCNHVRDKKRFKRGGGARRVPLAEGMLVTHDDLEGILVFDEVLTRLEKLSPRKFRVVMLRHYGGLNVLETAEVLGASEATVNRDWKFSKGWLAREFTR